MDPELYRVGVTSFLKLLNIENQNRNLTLGHTGWKSLPDPRGAGHAKAFQFLSVGPSVRRSVGRSVSLIVSVGPSVARSKAFIVFH